MNDLFEKLSGKIQAAYTEGVTLEEAEKLAGEFLHAQILVAKALMEADLDSRMKRSGTKAVKAAVYLEEATRSDKKPSDVLIGAIVDRSEVVQSSQQAFDEAEVVKNHLENQLSVLREGHIFFRGVSKGRFE